MEVLSIDISLIDFNDNTFLVGHKDDYSSIKNSIEELGLLNPPIVRENNGKYQIISGWKRVLSCKELGVNNISCKIYKHCELSERDCIKIIFYENKNNLSDLELAELIKLFKNLCSLEDSEIIKDILPLLGIASNRKHLDRSLALSSLDVSIKKAYYEDKITIEQCQMLADISENNRVQILNKVLLKYKLNNNESKQVINTIEEISLRDSISVNEVISIAENAFDKKKKDKNELRKELKRIRYPDLYNVEEKYKVLVDKLNLPDRMNVFVNPYFETNDLELRLKFKSSEELAILLRNLEENLEDSKFEELLSLVIRGD